jgi:polysaccharide biosynthesis transport protein
MAQYDVDLRDYWRIIKKRKFIIALMVILVGISSYGFAKLQEPMPLYSSTAAIKIEHATSLATILSGAYYRQAQSFVTHAFIMKSFPVLAETAKLAGWLEKDFKLDQIRYDPEKLAVIDRVKSMVAAGNEEGTNIINIKATSKIPEDAAKVANAMAQAYMQYNIIEKNRKTIETKEFIEKELEKTLENLKAAEKKLQAFNEGTALISIDTYNENYLTRIQAVETDLFKVREEIRPIKTQLEALGRQDFHNLVGFERHIFSAETYPHLNSMYNQLHELSLQRAALLTDFTEKHPRVFEINNRGQVIFSTIKKELSGIVSKLLARENALTEKIQQIKGERQSVPENTIQKDRLQREVNIQETLYKQLQKKYQETLVLGSGKIQEVSVVKPAFVPTAPFNIPSKFMIVMTGLIMGLVIGVVLSFGVELFDTSMGAIEDVEALLQVPVLGVIPFMGKEEKAKQAVGDKVLKIGGRSMDLITHYDPKSLPAEAFRALRSNLDFMSLESKGKAYLITSAFVQEGKTFNVVNLALSLTQAGNRVLLVEGDLRKPVIHKMFGLSRGPGLTDYILGNYEWEGITNTITDVMLGNFELDEILRTPGLDNLNILTAGTHPPNPAEILRSSRFRGFLKEAHKKYDYILIDAPPVLPVADATEISTFVDGVILVYTVGRIARGVLKRAKTSLDNVEAKVLGVILNNVKPESGPDYFKYHTQYYYGSKAKSGEIKRSLPPSVGERTKGGLFTSGWGKRLAVIVLVLVLLLVGMFWDSFFSFQ